MTQFMGAAKAGTLAVLLIAASVGAETAPTPAPADGGVEAPVLYDCPGGDEPALRVDGGWYLPLARSNRLSCLLIATQRHRDELMKQNDEFRAQPAAASWQTWAVVVGLAIATGFTAGFMARGAK